MARYFLRLLQEIETISVNLKLQVMLRWTVVFLIVAIIAAVFGFTGIAAGAASIARICSSFL